jgi:hypothetical protein
VPPTAAILAAETGGAILRVGFEQWTRDAKNRSLTFHLRAARRQLEGIVGARAHRPPSSRAARRHR